MGAVEQAAAQVLEMLNGCEAGLRLRRRKVDIGFILPGVAEARFVYHRSCPVCRGRCVSTIEVLHAWVDPLVRRQGVATAVWRALVAWFLQSGIPFSGAYAEKKTWLDKNGSCAAKLLALSLEGGFETRSFLGANTAVESPLVMVERPF